MAYDRYTKFRSDSNIEIVPFVAIEKRDTDRFERFVRNKTSLDSLSYKYYNDSGYAWLIMQANPEFGSVENEIPDGSLLRIPYPLNYVIEGYENGINSYNRLY